MDVAIVYNEQGNILNDGMGTSYSWDAKNCLEKMVDDLSDRIIELKYDYRGIRDQKIVTVNGIVEKHIAQILTQILRRQLEIWDGTLGIRLVWKKSKIRIINILCL